MALGIKHHLLRELRLRVLLYDCAMTEQNRDRLIIAARAVSTNFAEAQARSVERGTESRRRCWADRVERGLCRVCGRQAYRPGRTTCEGCARRLAANSRRLRASLKK